MIRAALDRRTLGLDLPERDRIRARLLKAMLAAVFKPEGG
jgi:transcriptional regulator CtsR